MKIRKHLRAGERKSVARFRDHFSGARQMAGIAYRVASLFAPVAVLAVLGLSMAHSGHFHAHSPHFVMAATSVAPIVKQLNKQKEDLLNRQETMLNSAQEAKRKFTDAEDAEYNKHEADIKDLTASIDRHTAIAAERSKLGLPTSRPVIQGNKKNDGDLLGQVSPRILSAEYFNAFYKNFGHLGRIKNDLLFEGADTDEATGGVIAPVVYEGQVIPLAPINMALRQLATVTPTSNDIKIPVQTKKSVAAIKTQTTSGGTHSFAATNPTIKLVTLGADMNGNYVPASIESLQDIGYLQSFVQGDISRAVLESEEGVYSDVLLDPTDGAVPYIASSVTIAAPESFLDVVAAQPSVYDNGSSWLMSKRTGFAIQKAQIAANQFTPFWTVSEVRNADGTIGRQAYFHGYPVFYSTKMENVGSPASDVVVFGNFKDGFIIGDRYNSAVLVKVDDITSFKDGVINIFGYRRSGSLVRNQNALQQVAL